jgi:PAS domain S-box-containing protein
VIAVKDTEGRYILVNAQGCRNFGRSKEEILGKTDRALLTGGTAEAVMEKEEDGRAA